MEQPPPDPAFIDLLGDAQILLTAPFFPSVDPLEHRVACAVPPDGVVDRGGRLIRSNRSQDAFLRGTLTYGNPEVEITTQFSGTGAFCSELAADITSADRLPVDVTVRGLLFPDGYGSVAVRIDVDGGWSAGQRGGLIETLGPAGREEVASGMREALLPALTELSGRCHGDEVQELLFPYFNLTYSGSTSHPAAGRARLPDELRMLVYPRSPEPIASDSPWSDEFFYAGYAYSLLASPSPQRTLEQLELLLLHLDVRYARMDRSAGAADLAIRCGRSAGNNVDFLVGLEQRLRADYQALVRPTFSFDYHVLKLRDALLSAWEADKVRERTDMLLAMARQAVERELADDQARRVSRVNLVVTILTILNIIATTEAAVNLWEKVVR